MLRLALALVLCVLLPAAPAAPAGETGPEADLIRAKCTLCHTELRIYDVRSENLQEIVDRMTAKNPEWFKDVGSPHLMEALSRMLDDPRVAAQRRAWQEAVARGKALFGDRALGGNGKACADCHTEKSLVGAAADYPKYDLDQARFQSLEERLDTMVRTKLGGAGLPLGDRRAVDLALFLKSLR